MSRAKTPAEKREEALRQVFDEATFAYVDATERGEGALLAGMTAAARMKIAAKDWVKAKRELGAR